MSNLNDPIDIDDTTEALSLIDSEWGVDDWIYKGKTYLAEDTPHTNEADCHPILLIPSEFSHYLLNPNLSITDLLQFELPIQLFILVLQ